MEKFICLVFAVGSFLAFVYSFGLHGLYFASACFGLSTLIWGCLFCFSILKK